ncbi:hypothetical protein ABEB36_015534 [Hypothenemus hampei]|uniref:Uncharacterized protein n=1 Tax=Hypothenemus hampei TaxID=57062 RepID=A0ABD1DZG6_HYPHA
MEYKLTARITRASPGAPCPYSPSVSALGVSLLFGYDQRCRPIPRLPKGEEDRPTPPHAAVSPSTTTSEENAVTHAPAVDGTMVSRPGECGTREDCMPYPLKTPLFSW